MQLRAHTAEETCTSFAPVQRVSPLDLRVDKLRFRFKGLVYRIRPLEINAKELAIVTCDRDLQTPWHRA